MTAHVSSGMQCGLAVIGVAALLTPGAPQPVPPAGDRPVALAAQMLPLPAEPTTAPITPLALLGRQVDFNVNFVVDFVVTGVQLTGRILDVPGALVHDLQTGTPAPVAVGRALVHFADVEFDAGRDLVEFGRRWLQFQIGFLTDLVAGLPQLLLNGPVGQVLTAGLRLASQFVDDVANAARDIVTATQNVVHNTVVPAPPAAAAPQSAPAPKSRGDRAALAHLSIAGRAGDSTKATAPQPISAQRRTIIADVTQTDDATVGAADAPTRRVEKPGEHREHPTRPDQRAESSDRRDRHDPDGRGDRHDRGGTHRADSGHTAQTANHPHHTGKR